MKFSRKLLIYLYLKRKYEDVDFINYFSAQVLKMSDVHISINIEEKPDLPPHEVIMPDQVLSQPNPGNAQSTITEQPQPSSEVQEIQSIQSVTSEMSSNNRSDLFIYASSAAKQKLQMIQSVLIANFAVNILGILLEARIISVFVILIVILASICLLLISIALGKIKIKNKKEKFFYFAQIVSLGAYLIVAGTSI